MSQKTTGKTGIGVLFKVGSADSPPQFVTVANCTQIQVGGVTLNTVDATHLDSPNFYQEFLPGLKSAAEVTFTLQWDPDNPSHNQLREILEKRELRPFLVDTAQIGLSVSLGFEGYVTELGNITISPEDVMTQDCTIQPSGAYESVANPPVTP